MTFQYEYLPTIEEIREHIQACEGEHMQQVAYSTFHDALTQICYGCRKIRSNIYKTVKEPESWNTSSSSSSLF